MKVNVIFYLVLTVVLISYTSVNADEKDSRCDYWYKVSTDPFKVQWCSPDSEIYNEHKCQTIKDKERNYNQHCRSSSSSSSSRSDNSRSSSYSNSPRRSSSSSSPGGVEVKEDYRCGRWKRESSGWIDQCYLDGPPNVLCKAAQVAERNYKLYCR